jgi:hypothetical protein
MRSSKALTLHGCDGGDKIMRLRPAVTIGAALLIANGSCRSPEDIDPAAHVISMAAVADTIRLVKTTTIEDAFGSISAVATDSRGRVFVADWLASEIRVYAADGALLTVLGRAGDGPGEYRSINSLQTHGDSLFVLDAQTRRVTVYSPFADHQGEMVRTIQVPAFDARPDQLMIGDSGKFFVRYTTFALGGPAGAPGVTVRSFTPEGELVDDTLVIMPGPEWLVMDGGAEWMPFGAHPTIRLSAREELWTNWSRDPVVRAMGASDDPPMLVQVDVEPRPVERAALDRLASKVGGTEPEITANRGRWAEAWRRGLIPVSTPVVHDFVVASDGRLWIMTAVPDEEIKRGPSGFVYVSPDPGRPVLVATPDSKEVALALIPSRARIVEVRDRAVTAVVSDSLGVQWIEIYSLNPSQAAI